VTPDEQFELLSARSQVVRLRAAAFEALTAYPLEVARLRLVYHGYNTTFRVDTTDQRTFALRINVNSHKTAPELRAEMAWIDALSRDTEVSVPVPQLTIAGGLTTTVWVPSLGRQLPAALFGWLSGPNVEDRAARVHLRAAGQAMARMHRHAEGWSLPADASLPASDELFMHGSRYLHLDHPLLTPERREVLERVIPQVQQRFAEVFASATPHVLHADLHLANMKWYRGRLSVFDFDDCVIGVPAHDLGVSTYYLRPRQELVDALFEGYASLRPLPVVSPDRFEALLVGRNVLLLNELLGTSSADFRDMLPTYAANTFVKLRHYLDHGEFRHDLPGVVRLF
jgi:Ser/Thr protein kinase RdoA (MazF antagonist)